MIGSISAIFLGAVHANAAGSNVHITPIRFWTLTTNLAWQTLVSLHCTLQLVSE